MAPTSRSHVSRRHLAPTVDIPVPAPCPVSAAHVHLPPDGPLRLGDVDLDAGRPAVARRRHSTAGAPRSSALWLTDTAVPDPASVWRRLVDLFPDTGLWPLLLRSLPGDDRRPWDDGELEPVPAAEVDAVDPAGLLTTQWADCLVPIGERPVVGHREPFGATFPGLAPPLPRRGPPMSAGARALAPGGSARIGLAACTRPADAVALAGWLGTINWTGPGEISAVLRSWEERFGVVLAGLGFDTLTLLVPHPPADRHQALPVAAEIAALCPDVIRQSSGATVERLAQKLVDLPVWHLWFD